MVPKVPVETDLDLVTWFNHRSILVTIILVIQMVKESIFEGVNAVFGLLQDTLVQVPRGGSVGQLVHVHH